MAVEHLTQAGYARRVLIAAGVIGLVLLVAIFLWESLHVVLLVFGAVLVAIILRALADPFVQHLGMGYRWAVPVVSLLLAVAILAFSWLIGGQLSAQVRDLAERLPQAVDRLEQSVGMSHLSERVLPDAISGAVGEADGRNDGASDGSVSDGTVAAEGAGPGGKRMDVGPSASSDGGDFGGMLGSGLLGQIFGAARSMIGIIADAVILVFGGIYLAVQPAIYRKGLLLLVPQAAQEEVGETLDLVGEALRRWLLGQLISMTVVGVMTTIGLWILGVPSPLALGLFAGLAEFIPLVGPILGAIPALLAALSQDFNIVLWTIGLFLVVQQLESNLLMPIVQRWVVSLPPALTLFAVTAMGLVFGPLGLFFAAPLTVVFYMVVKKVYVCDTLGHRTKLLG